MHLQPFIDTSLPVAPSMPPERPPKRSRYIHDLDEMEAMQEEAELKLLRRVYGRPERGSRQADDY